MGAKRKRYQMEQLSSSDESSKENHEHKHDTRFKRAKITDESVISKFQPTQTIQDYRGLPGQEVKTKSSGKEVSTVWTNQKKSPSKGNGEVNTINSDPKKSPRKGNGEVSTIRSDQKKSPSKGSREVSTIKSDPKKSPSKGNGEVSFTKSSKGMTTGKYREERGTSKLSQEDNTRRFKQKACRSKSSREVNTSKSGQELSNKKLSRKNSIGKSRKEVDTSKLSWEVSTIESSKKVSKKSSKTVDYFDKRDEHEAAGSPNCTDGETSQEVEVFDFSRKSWMSDVTFLIQGKRIYCSKTVLSVFSPVFKSMFTEKNDQNKGKKLVELPGKDYESFLEFLKCLFPNIANPNITKQNVFKILSLAYEYNVHYLTKQCEEYLMKSIEVREPCINTLMRILTKAKQFNLCSLKDICIKNLSEKDPFVVQASGNKLGLHDTLHYLQGEIVLMKHMILKDARTDLERTCTAFDMTDVLQAFGGFEQAEAAKLELCLKFDKTEELNNKTATSNVVRLYGLHFSAESVVYTPANAENETSYLNLFLKCVSDGSLAFNWSCDVRAKCMLKMRMTGRKSEQITKTKTFRFSESHAFFTGLKTRLGSSVGKNTGSLRGREFDAVVYFLVNRPKFSNADYN